MLSLKNHKNLKKKKYLTNILEAFKLINNEVKQAGTFYYFH